MTKPTPLHQTLIHMLPYKQQLKDNVTGQIYTLSSVTYSQITSTSDRFVVDVDHRKGTITRKFNTEFKPILRGLSDLDKEIEQDGRKFVPLEEINMDGEPTLDKNGCIYYADGLRCLSIGEVNRIMNKLLSWHFNCFNLSEDQFIPVTKEFNPY